jgi:hypothetical protein
MSSMGTTMTMVYIVWPRAFVVHVGDSRCYLLREGQLQQLTTDHTMATLLAESGKMSREQARHSPMGHALVNVLGGKTDELSVDVDKLTLKVADTLLLCTDGLYDMVSDNDVRRVLDSNLNAEVACRKLVGLAIDNGGKDNITLIVARFLAPQIDEPRAFVEAEIPLDELTGIASDATRTTGIMGQSRGARDGATAPQQYAFAVRCRKRCPANGRLLHFNNGTTPQSMPPAIDNPLPSMDVPKFERSSERTARRDDRMIQRASGQSERENADQSSERQNDNQSQNNRRGGLLRGRGNR